MIKEEWEKVKAMANDIMDLMEANHAYWKSVIEKKVYGEEKESEEENNAKDP